MRPLQVRRASRDPGGRKECGWQRVRGRRNPRRCGLPVRCPIVVKNVATAAPRRRAFVVGLAIPVNVRGGIERTIRRSGRRGGGGRGRGAGGGGGGRGGGARGAGGARGGGGGGAT